MKPVQPPNAAHTRAPLRPSSRNNLRWFWQGYIKEKIFGVVVLFVLVISQGGVYQQFLSLTDRSLRVILENGALTDLIWICVMVFCVFAYRGVISFVVPRFSAQIAADITLKLRQNLTAHLMTLDLQFFERTPPSEFILRLVQQIEALFLFITQTLIRLLRDAATVIVVSAYLFYKQPLLFTFALIVLPIILLLIRRLSARIKHIKKESEAELANYIEQIDEVVSGMRTVKITDQMPAEQTRLNRTAHRLRDLGIRLQTVQALSAPYVDFAAAFVYVLVIGGGGYVVLSPHYNMDGAEIITFLIGLIMVFDPSRNLAQFWTQMQAFLVILEQLRGITTVVPQVTDRPHAQTAFDVKADISVQNVSFSYAPDTPLFRGLNMRFEGAKTTAIVGATGSGKTTVLSLLARLYDPAKGTIHIGNVALQDIQQTALRQAFCVVSQDIVIFNASIRDNIRYVRPDCSDEELKQAAAAAEILELMEKRADEPVGPKGTQLSGGQRQRIGIARSFLKDAPIVFLDEATSALDQKTEDKVQSAMARLSKGRTTIMIAHRLSTVMQADMIYVMDAGAVVEQGTHNELMEKQGFYHSLFMAQQKNYTN